jgi:hypothetical protein
MAGKKINSCHCGQNFHWATYFTRSNHLAGDYKIYLEPVIFGLRFCEKGSFFPISWGKIPKSVVIKLFVKIVNESFFK